MFSVPFDIVVCSSVCAFLDDHHGTVKTLVGLLKPGGLFVQWDWELNPQDDEPFGLARNQVFEALTDADLIDVSVETAFEIDVDGQQKRPLIGSGSRRP